MRRATARVAAAFLVALGVLAGSAAVAHAAPLDTARFASRIDQALSLISDAGPNVASSTVAAQVASGVEGLLPPGLEVAEGTSTVVVSDLATVGDLADALRAAQDTAARTRTAAALREHLLSMRAAVGAPGAVPHDSAVLAALLAGRPVMTDRGQNWLSQQMARILEAIAKWLSRLDGASGSGSGPSWRVLAAMVVAVPLCIGLWVLARALRRVHRRRGRAVTAPAQTSGPVVAAAADLPADPLAYAETLASRGLTRDAVRALYGGAARLLVDAGLVTRMRTRTNHEMLRDVSASAPGLAALFGELTDAFEVAWYGHADPGFGGFQRTRATYARLAAQADPLGHGPDGESGPARGATDGPAHSADDGPARGADGGDL